MRPLATMILVCVERLENEHDDTETRELIACVERATSFADIRDVYYRAYFERDDFACDMQRTRELCALNPEPSTHPLDCTCDTCKHDDDKQRRAHLAERCTPYAGDEPAMCNHDTPRNVDARCTCDRYPGQSHCPLHGDDVVHVYNVANERWDVVDTSHDDDTQHDAHCDAFDDYATVEQFKRAYGPGSNYGQ